jgi:hypothetical protein
MAGPPEVPRALLRPCGSELVRATASAAARGRFRYLGIERDLGDAPFPCPADVPLLWAFEHLYLEELLDLALCGEHGAAIRLAALREAADRDPGPGGAHPYPEARRTASLVRALWRLPPPETPALACAAWRAAWRVRDNLERDVGGNHLLENGLALVLSGRAFAGARAAGLLRAGEAILTAEARRQVLPDGAHFELSPMYHARVLSVLAEGGLVLASAGRDPEPEYWETVGRMCAFLDGLLGPDGALPLLGDSVRDERFTPRMLLRAVEEILPFPVGPAPRGDRYHPDSGFCVLEDGERGDRLLLDAGPVCPDRLPAHGQADTFTFEFRAGGAEVVVDPGVGGYEAGPDRDWSRGTRSHSTVEVGGENSSEVFGSFRVGRRARVRGADFRRDGAFGTLAAEHDGYRHRGAYHARLVSHLGPGLYLVADRVRAARPAVSRSRIHFGPTAQVGERAGAGFQVHAGEALVWVVPFGAGRSGFEAGTCSPSFGSWLPTKLLTLTGSGRSVAFGYLLATGDRTDLSAWLDGSTVRVRADGREWSRALP